MRGLPVDGEPVRNNRSAGLVEITGSGLVEMTGSGLVEMTGSGLEASRINGRFSRTHPHGFNWFNPYAKRLTKSVYMFSSECARRTWSKVGAGGTALAVFRSTNLGLLLGAARTWQPSA